MKYYEKITFGLSEIACSKIVPLEYKIAPLKLQNSPLDIERGMILEFRGANLQSNGAICKQPIILDRI